MLLVRGEVLLQIRYCCTHSYNFMREAVDFFLLRTQCRKQVIGALLKKTCPDY